MNRKYFNGLNYTLGNEDASLELEAMPENAGHVFTIAGSGSRVTPLFAKNPRHVTCVDSSREQLCLAELRISSVKALSRKAFLAFWGYPGEEMSRQERKGIFDSLSLSDRAENFLRQLFGQNSWDPLLYIGKWEQAFRKISGINRKIVGKRGLEVFNCRTLEEQKDYFQTRFPRKAWAFSVFSLGNAAIFNALLYKGSFPRKNIKNSLYSHYMDAFRHLFENDLARNNFLLQLIFFGELRYQEGLPIECGRDLFKRAKQGIHNATIDYIHDDSMAAARGAGRNIDFLSLSDVSSYFEPPAEQNFLQDIKSSLSREAVVVNRYYLRVPENLNTFGYENITADYQKAIGRERVQMYSFGIYKKTST